MASRYTLGVRTPAAAAGAAYCLLRSTGGATTVRPRILEIGVATSAATLSSIGLIRTATIGTSSTTQACQAMDPAETATSLTTVDTAWSVAPTIAGSPAYLRRFALPATAGAGLIWTFDPASPLVISANGSATGSLVLWNFGGLAAAACDVYVVVEE